MATISKEEMAVKPEVIRDKLSDEIAQHGEPSATNQVQVPPVKKTRMSRKSIIILSIVACMVMTFVGLGVGFVIGHNTVNTRGGGRQGQFGGNDMRPGMMPQKSRGATNDNINTN